MAVWQALFAVYYAARFNVSARCAERHLAKARWAQVRARHWLERVNAKQESRHG